MAFELTNTNPFPETAFSIAGSERTGFTFDPSISDFTSWKADFESNISNLSLDLKQPVFSSSIASSATLPSLSGTIGGNSSLDSFGNILMGIKSKGDKALKAGYAMKTAAAAGDLFNSILTYTTTRENADLQRENANKSAENQMLALDNQVLYYKNQIADKFNQTIARNAVTMAAKNLRVTAANLLEKTKGAATEATEDIKMMESNAELKKIALRSEARQAEVASSLTKKLATANLIGSAAKLGLVVSGGVEAGAFGDIFASGGSLNETVYGS